MVGPGGPVGASAPVPDRCTGTLRGG